MRPLPWLTAARDCPIPSFWSPVCAWMPLFSIRLLPHPPAKEDESPRKAEGSHLLRKSRRTLPPAGPHLRSSGTMGIKRTIEILSGISLWYTPGQDPIQVRWVLTRTRDSKGKPRTEAFFSTAPEATAEQILNWFIMRWNVEVTFQELRAHLGLETQRQWSDTAIEKATPAIFSLFSLVVLMALEIIKTAPLPVRSSSWYHKPEATFSDVIAQVRRNIWVSRFFASSDKCTRSPLFQEDLLDSMLDLLCSSG